MIRWLPLVLYLNSSVILSHIQDTFQQHREPARLEQEQCPDNNQCRDQHVKQHDRGVVGDEQHQLTGIFVLIQFRHAHDENGIQHHQQPVGHGITQRIVRTFLMHGTEPCTQGRKACIPCQLFFHVCEITFVSKKNCRSQNSPDFCGIVVTIL